MEMNEVCTSRDWANNTFFYETNKAAVVCDLPHALGDYRYLHLFGSRPTPPYGRPNERNLCNDSYYATPARVQKALELLRPDLDASLGSAVVLFRTEMWDAIQAWSSSTPVPIAANSTFVNCCSMWGWLRAALPDHVLVGTYLAPQTRQWGDYMGAFYSKVREAAGRLLDGRFALFDWDRLLRTGYAEFSWNSVDHHPDRVHRQAWALVMVRFATYWDALVQQCDSDTPLSGAGALETDEAVFASFFS
jgi:hypothetical protein